MVAFVTSVIRESKAFSGNITGAVVSSVLVSNGWTFRVLFGDSGSGFFSRSTDLSFEAIFWREIPGGKGRDFIFIRRSDNRKNIIKSEYHVLPKVKNYKNRRLVIEKTILTFFVKNENEKFWRESEKIQDRNMTKEKRMTE